MIIDFSLTPKARADLAEQLRGPALVEPLITPAMEHTLERVWVREQPIPTRHGDARCFIVSPHDAAATPRPVFVNFHGGGFVRPHQRTDTLFCAEFADRSGALVIDVDYRLAPEYPFPIGLEQSHDVVQWLAEHAATLGADATRIVVGGHSAGGNFATAVAMLVNASGAFRLCGQILDYPYLDGLTAPEQKIDRRSVMPTERMQAFNVLYAQTPENLANPLLSPVLAEPERLRGMAPALIVIAGKDPLRFEAQRYAAKLIDADVDVDVRQYADSDHGFVMSAHDQYAAARETIYRWFLACVDRQTQ